MIGSYAEKAAMESCKRANMTNASIVIESLMQQRAEMLEALKVVLPIATKSNSLSVKDYNKAAQAITKAEAAE